MSKRSCITLVLVAAIAAGLALTPSVAYSQSRATIIIDSLASEPQPGDTITLAVSIENLVPGTSINAFDLLIQFDYHFLRPIDVQPGALLASCGWEFFDFRTSPPDFCRLDTCPDGKLRLVALADVASDPGSPTCFIEQSGQLALITFEISSRQVPDCDFYLPVNFAWGDCGDNMVSLSSTPDTLLISNRVFVFGYEVTADSPFPTSGGAPNACVISSGSTGLTARGIDYVGGGIFLGCPLPLASGVEIGIQDFGDVTQIGQEFSVHIDVLRIAPGYQLGSFEFYLKYDPTKMTFVSGSPGNLIDACNYALVEVLDGPDANCVFGPCPEGVIRVMALAHGLSTSPTCYIDEPGHLMSLRFQLAYDSSLICSSLPLDFIWYKCGDNSLTEAPDEILGAFPRHVFDRLGFILPDTGITFPSTAGDADTCPAVPNPTVDLFQGVILVPCAYDQDYRGDINLNGIANEIADFVSFSNYFVYGSAAFTVDPSRQALYSDINADGVVLSLNDLIYLLRVVLGDVQPFASPVKAIGDTALFLQDVTQKTVSMQYVDSLTAVYFVFEGEITSVTVLAPDLISNYSFDGTHTRVALLPGLGIGTLPLPAFGSGAILSYTGDALLIGAEASSDGIASIQTEISIPGLQQCCVTRGNTDHSANQTIDINDATTLVEYMFGEGGAPPCLEEANVNASADGIIDISDLVSLIKYMFLNGDPPVACPSPTKAWRYIAQLPGSVAVEGLFTMTVDDPPFGAGRWFLTQLDENAIVGPQVGQGAWYGNEGEINMNMTLAPSQVRLHMTQRLENYWFGTWEYLNSGATISSGQVILLAL